MDIERHLLRVRGPTLIAETVVVFAVGMCGKGIVFVGNSLLIVLAVAERILDLELTILLVLFIRGKDISLPVRQGSSSCFLSRARCKKPPDQGKRQRPAQAYPEVNLEVSTATKLPVANLEGDCHQIIAVQNLVEALS